ncbi:MAG: hypothetical protein H6739_32490 [Alphaproteobacteria bacterium]|nr:hypothetical protein [Alphaproteobacteria bacterium]
MLCLLLMTAALAGEPPAETTTEAPPAQATAAAPAETPPARDANGAFVFQPDRLDGVPAQPGAEIIVTRQSMNEQLDDEVITDAAARIVESVEQGPF